MKKNSLLIHGGISIDEKTGAVNIPMNIQEQETQLGNH